MISDHLMSVEREVYTLPMVDKTLGQLLGATLFSKLDANCGFWQIPTIETSNYVHHTIWKILVQQTNLWDLQRPRMLPVEIY